MLVRAGCRVRPGFFAQVLPLNSHCASIENPLTGLAAHLDKTGTQAFMIGHQSTHRQLQSIAMQLTAHLQCQRHMVGTVFRFQLLHKPEPTLGGRTGQVAVARHRLNRRHGLHRLTPQGTLLEQWLLKNPVQRQIQLMLMAQPVNHLHRQQRMAPQIEKVVIAADAFQPQQGLPDCRQNHFVIGLRRLAATARLPLGQGQCLAVHLARWRQRHGFQDQQLAGNHIVWEFRDQLSHQRIGTERSARYQIPHQPITTR